MDNIKEVSNMPIETYNTFIDYYYLNPEVKYVTWWEKHHAYQIPLEDRKKLRKLLPLQPSDIYLYKLLPQTEPTLPHKDRGRRSCFQIPCNHNPKFQTFSQRNDVKLTPYPLPKKHRPPHKNEKINMLNDGPLFFIYEPENYEMYDTSKPYLQNVAKAHGGFNSSNIDRYLWSFSFIEEYDYVCDAFREWI